MKIYEDQYEVGEHMKNCALEAISQFGAKWGTKPEALLMGAREYVALWAYLQKETGQEPVKPPGVISLGGMAIYPKSRPGIDFLLTGEGALKRVKPKEEEK